jgi:hypothetical protein
MPMAVLTRNAPPAGAARSVELLRGELEHLGIKADVHTGHGIALVSVWVGLVVWCDGQSYRWSTGRKSPRDPRLVVYAFGPVDDPVTAARRVARRYVELRENHPLSALILQALSTPDDPWLPPALPGDDDDS